MESHLLQMRGLKLLLPIGTEYPHNVASFTDAWIETNLDKQISLQTQVASFTDAWIETLLSTLFLSVSNSRIFYRCVD